MVVADYEWHPAERRQFLKATRLRGWQQEARGEPLMNALRERVWRVVGPAVVGPQAVSQSQQRVRTGVVQLLLQGLPDLVQRQPAADDGGDTSMGQSAGL